MIKDARRNGIAVCWAPKARRHELGAHHAGPRISRSRRSAGGAFDEHDRLRRLFRGVDALLDIIGVRLRQDLGLNETQFGLLVGAPILTGSLIRIVLGIWADRYGGRLVFTVKMLAASVATFLLSYAHTYAETLVAALGVGVAGGSFAVGIAYVSRWYPMEKQGAALGIFGIGNVRAAVTKFVALFVLVACEWQTVAQLSRR